MQWIFFFQKYGGIKGEPKNKIKKKMEWSHNKKKRWYAETGVKGIPKQNEHSYKKKE